MTLDYELKPIRELDPKEVVEMLPAYVLGALETDEMLAVDNYINRQRTFLGQVRQAEDAAALLTHTVQPVTPPTNIRRVIMTIARFDAPAASQATAGSITGNGPPPGLAGPSGANPGGASPSQFAITPYRPQAISPLTKRQAGSLAQRRRSSSPIVMPVFTVSNRLWQATALTALLVLLLLAGLGTLLNRRLSEVQGQVVEKEQKVSELLTQNSQTQVENENLALQLNQLTEQNQLLREGQDQAMKELLDAHGRMQIISDADRVVLLRSAQANINARATFYVSDQQGALAVSGFAPLASEQNYQIWLADAENRRYPLALFNVVDTNRPFWKLAQLPAGLSNFVSVFVTIEPASGSAQPTGPILISSVGL